MSYLEKIAEKVGAVQESTLERSIELAHEKVAMLDDIYGALTKMAEAYDSQELSEAAEIMGAVVENEAMDVDNTLQKMAEMFTAGPTVSGLLEKRAEAQFEGELLNECERIALLGDIADFTKTAAEEVGDADMWKVAEAIEGIIVSDLEELDGILKQAGITLSGFQKWLGENSARVGDFFKSLYGSTKGVAKGTQLRSGVRDFKAIGNQMGGESVKKILRTEGAKKIGLGAAKTGLLYGGAGAAGYGGYRALRKK